MRNSVQEKPLVTVQFYDPETGYENIWALPLGDGTYRLENPPFFIYDISLSDVVAALPDEEGVLQFLSVVRHSGNRTVRARSDDSLKDPGFRSTLLANLRGFGCQTEEHRDTLLSINVPPEIEINKVTSYLTASGLSWEYGSPAGLNT